MWKIYCFGQGLRVPDLEIKEKLNKVISTNLSKTKDCKKEFNAKNSARCQILKSFESEKMLEENFD